VELDKLGMPELVSKDHITEITNCIYDRYHEEIVSCAVCNQFIEISKSKLFPFNKAPRKLFSLLTPPDGSGNSGKPLHPENRKQYNISELIPENSKYKNTFKNVLLSPNGILIHSSNCSNAKNCRCTPHLYICDISRNSCLPKLKAGKLPKFSIANGNWVGQLPTELQNMSFGSLSLMRPIQSYGRVTTFQGTTGPGGSSLKGHVYSTPLPTALVAQKVPIQPGNSVVRVLVVSPFTSDPSALYKGKMASTKEDYIIEPTKIIKLHKFWCDVDNEIMKKIQFDEEEIDSIMISCTVTIREKDSPNQNQELLNQLDSTATTSFQPSSNTFVVRPAQKFVSDSDPDYLETRYPDLFPFGRAGFDEKRKIKISKKALIAYYTNLSTRQFQKPDFILPVYDMIARNSSYNMALVRANLPSREINKDGNVIPRAEAYSRIPLEDLRQLAEYQSICIKHQLLGKRAPRPPASSSGLASTFFTDQKISNQAMQHSQAAAQRNRQDVYAAHANNGKANIWLTISPDDAKSFKVLWYALDPKESAPSANAIPQGSKRFALLSKHPGAAALNFQRILKITIEDIIGWSLQKSRPFKKGGLFGIPKAWLRVVEEQSRLTLHTHMLIWLYGHSEIENQLTTALKRDEEQQETEMNKLNTNMEHVSNA